MLCAGELNLPLLTVSVEFCTYPFMDNWDEVRTAFHVARMGTVSGAADVLGVHHATVIRHIDALEGRLGVKLFQRHARGYTPTEAGEDLLRIGQATEDQLNQLAGRLKGQSTGVTGELVVTSLASLAPMIAPALVEFQRLHPGLSVQYPTGDRLFRLEYGEAHVAIRAGAAPEQPDNVVQPFFHMPVALYASKDYIARQGKPDPEQGFDGHQFVGFDDAQSRAPFNRWLREFVPPEAISFKCSGIFAHQSAVLAGGGIGFLSCRTAAQFPDLVQIMPPQEEWLSPLWLVTHVDLHRTTKVQSFLSFLKDKAKGWKA